MEKNRKNHNLVCAVFGITALKWIFYLPSRIITCFTNEPSNISKKLANLICSVIWALVSACLTIYQDEIKDLVASLIKILKEMIN